MFEMFVYCLFLDFSILYDRLFVVNAEINGWIAEMCFLSLFA